MKTRKRSFLSMIVFFTLLLLLSTGKSQNWLLGGNPNGGANGLVTNSNFLGSNANTWIRMGVNNSQDIFIDNDPTKLFPGNPSAPAFLKGGHWIGLGRIFRPTLGPGANPPFAPKAHLHIHGDNQAPGLPGFGSGLRTWFNTGVLMSEGTDAMYVGLRDLFPLKAATC